MEMKKIAGKIEVIAKTGGIKLDSYKDMWFNPEDNTKNYARGLNKGDFVEFEVDEKQGIHFIKKMAKQGPKQATEEVDWEGKEHRMVRMNAGQHAQAIMDILQKEDHLQGKTPAEIKVIFFELAKEYEQWVWQ